MKHIVIIGNGIAGVTAARHIRKNSDYKITIISSETKYFFSRTALMYVFMGHMKFEHTQPYENWFWKKNKIDLVQAYVQKVNNTSKTVLLDNKTTITYDDLIIATGSKPNKFGWSGQDLKGVMGMYSKQDLEEITLYAKDCKRAVIVGGGLIGIEMAEMFVSKKIPVTFLVREASFWNKVLPAQESEIINKHIKEHHIDLRLDTNMIEILSDENGRAKGVVTDKGEIIECNLVGLTAGVSPNISFLKDSGIDIDKGILVNRNLETNIQNIYAIGDCAQQHTAIGERRPIEAVWYTGRMMGETIARTICGTATKYNPGHWFNSAKFLDIEYQTYGWITTETKEYEARFYWEHASGKKCLHFNFNKDSRKFIGVNTLGIRLRHPLFDQWLTQEKTIEYVLEHLKDANFDPEFYKQHEKEILAKFNLENNTKLQVKKKSWKRIFQVS